MQVNHPCTSGLLLQTASLKASHVLHGLTNLTAATQRQLAVLQVTGRVFNGVCGTVCACFARASSGISNSISTSARALELRGCPFPLPASLHPCTPAKFPCRLVCCVAGLLTHQSR